MIVIQQEGGPVDDFDACEGMRRPTPSEIAIIEAAYKTEEAPKADPRYATNKYAVLNGKPIRSTGKSEEIAGSTFVSFKHAKPNKGGKYDIDTVRPAKFPWFAHVHFHAARLLHKIDFK